MRAAPASAREVLHGCLEVEADELWSVVQKKTNPYWVWIALPAAQHQAITKHARKTNYIERCTNTLRQRISRLVRSTLAFSNGVEHPINALRSFIGHYTLTRAAFLV